jgi:hypothetical protein
MAGDIFHFTGYIIHFITGLQQSGKITVLHFSADGHYIRVIKNKTQNDRKHSNDKVGYKIFGKPAFYEHPQDLFKTSRILKNPAVVFPNPYKNSKFFS